MESKSKEKKKNASPNSSSASNTSYVTLHDGRVKRRRQKLAYKDIYLEKFNFVPVPLPETKKGFSSCAQSKTNLLSSDEESDEDIPNQTKSLIKQKKMSKSCANYDKPPSKE
ncbi:MAG: hypothetical protein MJ252_22540, partial [archaeon]|nr:hypothetical protein [archaeon]